MPPHPPFHQQPNSQCGRFTASDLGHCLSQLGPLGNVRLRHPVKELEHGSSLALLEKVSSQMPVHPDTIPSEYANSSETGACEAFRRYSTALFVSLS